MDGQYDLVLDLREGGDWSLDLLFAGLVSNFGPEGVVDFPYKNKHREWGEGENDWGKERRTLGYHRFNSLIPKRHAFEIIKDSLQGLIRRVWLDERWESYEAYRSLGFHMLNIPTIVVACHDKFQNSSPSFVRNSYYPRNFKCMLLDNWQIDYESLPFDIRWHGWSINFDHYWDQKRGQEKEFDICFSGYNSHSDRARFIDHIEDKWPSLKKMFLFERRPHLTDVYMQKQEYFSLIDRSKICLNLRGAADGGKTMRFYEIPYVGSYMLSQVMPDFNLQREFEPGIHCDYFHDEKTLDLAIEQAMDNPDRREAIARAGHEHAANVHTVTRKIYKVLEYIKGLPIA